MTTVVTWLWATPEGDRWIVFLKNPVVLNTFYKMFTRLLFVVREDFLTAASTMRTGLQMMVLTSFLQHHQVFMWYSRNSLFWISIFSWGSHLLIASYACRMSLGMRLTYALPVEALATRIKRDSMFFFWRRSRWPPNSTNQQCYEAWLPWICLLNHCKSTDQELRNAMKHLSKTLIRATNAWTGNM